MRTVVFDSGDLEKDREGDGFCELSNAIKIALKGVFFELATPNKTRS